MYVVQIMPHNMLVDISKYVCAFYYIPF